MEFTVLGSGSSVPHPRRSSSGYWVQTSAGSVLFDCSASAIHRMAQEKLDWVNLDAIWISHFHLDHIGGLAPFLFGTKYAPETQERRKPLRIFGAAGLEKLVRAFDETNSYNLFKQPFPLEIVEIEAREAFEILPGVEAVALKTPHTDDSHAIHLRDREGKTIVYSADTGFTKELSAFASNVDLFVLECSFVRNKPVEKHLELEEALFLIRRSKAKSSMLTHFYPEWDEVDFAAEVAKIDRTANVLEAVDGLRIMI